MNRLKKYSFILWILTAVLIFSGASSIYRNYAAAQIIKKSFGSESQIANENKKNNEEKPDKNSKGMPLVPDFSLENEKGEKVSLSDYSGKVVILNFWASWCPPCKAEMPEFNELNNELIKTKDAVLITINLTDGQRETIEKASKFIKDNKYGFTVLYDIKGDVSDIFGVQSIPTTVIIDKEGYLHDYIMGATTKRAVLSSVEEVK